MSEFTFEVVTIPVSEGLGRAAAIVENDRDVAFGLPVDGFMLDAFERLDRDVATEIDRRVCFGA